MAEELPERPARVAGIARLLTGVALAGFGPIWMTTMSARRPLPTLNAWVAAAVFAVGVSLLLAGVANVAGRRLGGVASLLFVVAIWVAAALGGIAVSAAHWRGVEATAWANALRENDVPAWSAYDSRIPDMLKRPGHRQGLAMAMVRASPNDLRELTKGIELLRSQAATDPTYGPALQAARDARRALYDAAIAKLAAPPADAAKADPTLRASFAKVLADLAGRDDARVEMRVEESRRTERSAASYVAHDASKRVPAVRAAFPDGLVPTIPLDPALAPERADARRRAVRDGLRSALHEALGAGYVDFALPDAGDGRGEFVLACRAVHRLGDTVGILAEPDGRVRGVYDEVRVDWSLALIGRDGAPMWTGTFTCTPASPLSFRPQKADEDWHLYLEQLNAAAYDGGRQFAERLGLQVRNVAPAIDRMPEAN